MLIIAPVAASFDGLELRELLLPVPEDMGLDAAQVADLTNGEVTLRGNRGQYDSLVRNGHGRWSGRCWFCSGSTGGLPRLHSLTRRGNSENVQFIRLWEQAGFRRRP